MNSQQKRLPVFIAGAAIFGMIYWWLTSNGIVTEYIRPQVESGKLGSANGNTLATLVEVLASGAGLFAAIATRLVSYMGGLITPLVSYFEGILDPSPTVPQGTGDVPEDAPAEAMLKTLLYAIESKDASLVISLLHRMAGKPFLNGHLPPEGD